MNKKKFILFFVIFFFETERERQRLSQLIHRDYKNYFGISLGINFDDIDRTEVLRQNTSGQFKY
jgi:hypothetical protein